VVEQEAALLYTVDMTQRPEDGAELQAAACGDVEEYYHRSEETAIVARVDEAQREKGVDEGDGVETDGGFEELSALERQAEALEDVAEQMRIQNAALVELTRTLDKLVAVEMTGHPEDSRSGRSVAGWVEDAALDLEERVDLDAVHRAANRGDR
jgi:hypothetical protein